MRAATSPRSQLGWTNCFPEHAETCKFTTVFVSAVFGTGEGTVKEQYIKKNAIKFKKHANYTLCLGINSSFPKKRCIELKFAVSGLTQNLGTVVRAWCTRGTPNQSRGKTNQIRGATVERPINSHPKKYFETLTI